MEQEGRMIGCVVRMEMPKEGCHTCDARCVSALYGYICGITRKNVIPFLGKKNRPDWCPIICQLPEGHGRLVDADAYSAEMKDRQDAAWKWRNEAIAEEDELKLARAEGAFSAFVEAKLTWDKQVTIVPAERSEK